MTGIQIQDLVNSDISTVSFFENSDNLMKELTGSETLEINGGGILASVVLVVAVAVVSFAAGYNQTSSQCK